MTFYTLNNHAGSTKLHGFASHSNRRKQPENKGLPSPSKAKPTGNLPESHKNRLSTNEKRLVTARITQKQEDVWSTVKTLAASQKRMPRGPNTIKFTVRRPGTGEEFHLYGEPSNDGIVIRMPGAKNELSDIKFKSMGTDENGKKVYAPSSELGLKGGSDSDRDAYEEELRNFNMGRLVGALQSRSTQYDYGSTSSSSHDTWASSSRNTGSSSSGYGGDYENGSSRGSSSYFSSNYPSSSSGYGGDYENESSRGSSSYLSSNYPSSSSGYGGNYENETSSGGASYFSNNYSSSSSGSGRQTSSTNNGSYFNDPLARAHGIPELRRPPTYSQTTDTHSLASRYSGTENTDDPFYNMWEDYFYSMSGSHR
jgi:hypothetical protein